MGRKVTVLLAILCLAYAASSVCAVHRVGFSRHLEEILFSSPDGVGYRAVSDYLIGIGEKPKEYLALRPFFYPLVLSVRHLTGATGFILFQALLNVGTLILVFLAVHRITRSALFSTVAFLVVLLHPTFTFVALHALPETLCLFLMAAIVFCIASFCLHPNKPALFISLFLLSCATCSKPSFLPFLVLWAAFAAFRACRETVKREGQRIRALAIAAPALILSVSPVLFQLAQTYRSIGQAVISTSGRENFDFRFFPAVYGYAEQNRLIRNEDDIAKESWQLYPTHHAKVRYVAAHGAAAIRAAAAILFENLTAGSVFVGNPEKFVRDPALCHWLYRLSTFMNRRCFVLHAGFLLLLPVWLLMLRRDPVLFRLCIVLEALSLSILLPSFLSYSQGDRLIISALSAWVVLYASVGHAVLLRLSGIQRHGVAAGESQPGRERPPAGANGSLV